MIHPRRERYKRGLSVLVFAIATSACHAITETEVITDVQRVVATGMPLQNASEALQNVGFRCMPNYMANFVKGDIECDRHGGSGILPIGCVQRMFIDLDKKRRVSRIHDPLVACAGF